ncbi:MAG: hypothetical protein GY752_08895 [bacterium]|nr:hypothetical protein [bacterium]
MQYNARIRSAKIESFLDPEVCEIDNTFWPTKDDFTTIWDEMSYEQRNVVSAALSAKSFGELLDSTAKPPPYLAKKLKTEPKVGRAILIGRMCALPSDTARAMFIEGFIGAQQARKYFYDEVQKIIKTDKDHLKELAEKLAIDGDGKRGILKEIVAYGMQVKKVEDPVICPDTHVEITPMVIALADPRMAFNALQELNRMDHEYGQDDKATSSIESQAERIKRLKGAMNKTAEQQARTVNVVAKRVATRELKLINDTSQGGV